MTFPLEFKNENPKLVLKLNKTLYGLKQALRAWNARFDEISQKNWVFSHVKAKDACITTLNREENFILLC